MTDRLRVLMVGPLPPPSGGMANQTRQLKRLLEGEGIDVPLVQTNAPYRPAWVGRIRGFRALFRLVPFRRALAREAPNADVVHVMANSGWAWHLLAAPAIDIARRYGKPVVVNYRGGLAAEFLAKAAPTVRSTLRDAHLVVPSRFLQEVFGAHGMKASIVPNVVDIGTFHPAPGMDDRERSRPTHIVIARALEPIYGIDLALRAVAQVRKLYPDLKVSIAGTGPERQCLEAQADELGLGDTVRFTGRLEVEEMARLYQTADIVLNPVRADNTPNSVLEALACGVPVVSTRVGGVPYLVEHEATAILVDPESPEALASGLQRVIEDAGLRRRLGTNGLALAHSCAWPRVRDLWMQTYRSVAA